MLRSETQNNMSKRDNSITQMELSAKPTRLLNEHILFIRIQYNEFSYKSIINQTQQITNPKYEQFLQEVDSPQTVLNTPISKKISN